MTPNHIKFSEPLRSSVSLESLEAELAAFYAALAIVLEECYAADAGRRMLKLSDEQTGIKLQYVDVRSTLIGKRLPVWFRYAYEGVRSAGFDSERLHLNDGPFERLNDMLGLLRTDDGYFEYCLSGADPRDIAKGHLADLAKRLEARSSLDLGHRLTLADIALLADMNERSVRNALSAAGDGQLHIDSDGFVTNEEATRWLNGRRGFLPTDKRDLPKDLGMLPDTLLDTEIPVYVRARLEALSTAYEPHFESVHDTWKFDAAQKADMPIHRLEAAIRLPLDIRPQECVGLAKAMKVDPVWFTHQVMTALFPTQMDMLLNPGAWRARDGATDDGQPALRSITVELTAAMIGHGYLDLPASCKTLFPEDCFGSREKGDKGGQVELVYGGHRATTDIRIKSKKTISPRRRLSSWLQTELVAKPGDRIRLDKTADRVFTLTHLAK